VPKARPKCDRYEMARRMSSILAVPLGDCMTLLRELWIIYERMFIRRGVMPVRGYGYVITATRKVDEKQYIYLCFIPDKTAKVPRIYGDEIWGFELDFRRRPYLDELISVDSKIGGKRWKNGVFLRRWTERSSKMADMIRSL